MRCFGEMVCIDTNVFSAIVWSSQLFSYVINGEA